MPDVLTEGLKLFNYFAFTEKTILESLGLGTNCSFQFDIISINYMRIKKGLNET